MVSFALTPLPDRRVIKRNRATAHGLFAGGAWGAALMQGTETMAGDPRESRNERDREAAAERDYERRYGKTRTGGVGPGSRGEPRSWWNRASDEVSAWFGNPGALSRRQRDQAAGSHKGEGPQSHLDPDARIVDDVSRRLTEDDRVNASKVEVLARAGEVTLNGTVTTSAERARAEELAAAVAGVNQVQNKLLVA